MNPMQELMGRGKTGIVDPWDWQDPSDCPPAKCRMITVTNAMRAADAARIADRERAAADYGRQWRERMQFDEANLRVIKVKTKPGRQEQRGVIPVSTTRKGRPARTSAVRGDERPCAGGCGRISRTAQALCWDCRHAEAAKPKAITACSNGCGRKKVAKCETCSVCRRLATVKKPRSCADGEVRG